MTSRLPKIEDLFSQYLKEKRFITNCTERTLHCYQEVFNRWQKFAGGFPTKSLLTEFVVGMRQANLSVTTCNISIRTFNAFLSWLHTNEHIKDPIRLTQIKGEKKVMRVFSDQQLQQLLKWKPDRDSRNECRIHAILSFLVDTGARITECLHVKDKDVDFDNLLIKLYGKGRKERVVPMSLELRKILHYYKSHHRETKFPSEYFFCTINGTPISYRNAYRDMEAVFKKVGLDKGDIDGFFHSWRRKYARSFLRHGGNLLYLQVTMGHSTPGVTKQYVEVENEDLQALHIKTSLLARLK